MQEKGKINFDAGKRQDCKLGNKEKRKKRKRNKRITQDNPSKTLPNFLEFTQEKRMDSYTFLALFLHSRSTYVHVSLFCTHFQKCKRNARREQETCKMAS